MIGVFGVIIVLLNAAAMSSASSTTRVGLTFNPISANIPSENVTSLFRTLNISSVNLVNPTRADVRLYYESNISISISLPMSQLHCFAVQRSCAIRWATSRVRSFSGMISMISVGYPLSYPVNSNPPLMKAIWNLHEALTGLEIKHIRITTCFSFADLVTSTAPQSARFRESDVVYDLLDFLQKTDSPLFVKMYPYDSYKSSQSELSFALFQNQSFNYRKDVAAGVKYRNLFDSMLDSLVTSLAICDHEGVAVIVETGWPQDEIEKGEDNYAEMYLQGLLDHLKLGSGTHISKEVVSEVFIYQLFDVSTVKGSIKGESSQKWGILYPNGTFKYKVQFGSAGPDSYVVSSDHVLVDYFVEYVLPHIVADVAKHALDNMFSAFSRPFHWLVDVLGGNRRENRVHDLEMGRRDKYM